MLIEQMKNETYKVLDHGYVKVLDWMGTDTDIAQAARMSTTGDTKGEEKDRKLLRYLYKNRHTSPFEMCEIKLEVKLPIFVARQWIRHRTANVNEYSMRYSEAVDDFYVPQWSELLMQSGEGSNQSGQPGLNVGNARKSTELIKAASEDAWNDYQTLLYLGVAREQARMVLPVNIYTKWVWKIDLHNLLHFLTLRTNPHAQYEIREYAVVIAKIVEVLWPWTYEVWSDILFKNG